MIWKDKDEETVKGPTGKREEGSTISSNMGIVIIPKLHLVLMKTRVAQRRCENFARKLDRKE